MSHEMRDIINKFRLTEAEISTTTDSTPAKDDVATMKSDITNATAAQNEMNTGNKLFTSGKFYEAYKQYKIAQQKEPNYFWAYYNAANAAFNAGNQQAYQLIPGEIAKAKSLIQTWTGDEKEKSLALHRYQNLIQLIRKHTNLNI